MHAKFSRYTVVVFGIADHLQKFIGGKRHLSVTMSADLVSHSPDSAKTADRANYTRAIFLPLQVLFFLTSFIPLYGGFINTFM